MITAKSANVTGAKKSSYKVDDTCPSSLNSGFRDRLIVRLDEAGIPAHARTAYLAALTERAAQTVSRWLDLKRPGLPDLASFERLCRALACSADGLLALPQSPTDRGRKREAAAMHSEPRLIHSALELLGEMMRLFDDCEPMRMSGDEMAPRIHDGDLVFVDRTVVSLAGNGIYVIELDGRVMIRTVESRIGTGLVFRCDNDAYEDNIIKDAATARRLGLRVLGRVNGAIGLQRLKGG
jgi:hypothetical protein